MICKSCGTDKNESDFYKGDKTCKDCRKEKARANRKEKAEYYREYDRKRGNRQPEGYLASYREKYPNKYRAHNLVNNSIRDGKLKKETECQSCGSSFAVHAHHDDYAYPLSVRWLCAACHKQWHTVNGEALNP